MVKGLSHIPQFNIDLFRDGDREQFAMIYNLIWTDLVMGIAYQMRDEDEAVAEDIAHDTIEEIWEKRGTFNDFDHIRGFAFTVGNRGAAQYYRSAGTLTKNAPEISYRLEQDIKTSHEPLRLSHYVEQRLYKRLYEELDELPERERTAVLLWCKGLRLKEIAERLNVTPQAVWKLQQKGLRLLRQELEGEERLIALSVLLLVTQQAVFPL
jgi:RNA polymerase sigma factor (sigma-70 family)